MNSSMNSCQKAAVYVGLPLFMLLVGSSKLNAAVDGEPNVITPATTSSKDQVTPSTGQSEVVVVSGLFVRTFGDPPPGTGGKARISYTLTTSTGKEWVLVFDQERYWPANGVRGFLRRQVVVNGRLQPDRRLLVDLLELQ